MLNGARPANQIVVPHMISKPSALPRDIRSLRRILIEKEILIAEKEAQLTERDRVIAVRDAELSAKTLQIENLKAQLAKLRRARFGRSSEKLDRETALDDLVAPVSNMLENEQTEDHFGRRRRPAATAALGTSLGERFVKRRHDLFIPPNLIGVGHPFFAKVAHLFGNQTLTEAQLRAPHLNRGVSSVMSIRRRPDTANRG
jgi:hypothetical protein